MVLACKPCNATKLHDLAAEILGIFPSKDPGRAV